MRGVGVKENLTSSIQDWQIMIFNFFLKMQSSFGSSGSIWRGEGSKLARNWRRRLWMAP